MACRLPPILNEDDEEDHSHDVWVYVRSSSNCHHLLWIEYLVCSLGDGEIFQCVQEAFINIFGDILSSNLLKRLYEQCLYVLSRIYSRIFFF